MKRRARGRTLRPQEVRVPGILVDVVVGRSRPAPDDADAYSCRIRRALPAADSYLELAEWGPEKVIARRVAQELRDGGAVNLGFGVSAHVPRILIEEGPTAR